MGQPIRVLKIRQLKPTPHEVAKTVDDLQGGLRFVEIRGAHRHRRRAGHHELDGVRGALDAAHADDGDADGLGGVPDQLDCDRFDARPAQPARAIGQPGPACLDVDGHCRKAVGDGQRVATGLLRRFGIRCDVDHIWAQLGDERQGCRLPTGRHHLMKQSRIGSELGAAFLDVRTRDVQFERADTAEGIQAFLEKRPPDWD